MTLPTTAEGQLKFLATHYAEATEWNLATLEELLSRKGSSKASVTRQRSICSKMLQTCALVGLSVEWSIGMWDSRLTKFTRTKRILFEAPNVEQGLDTFVQSCKP